MEIKHLKLVKEIVEKGNLTKAGEYLFLTQSAISHQLKELEFQLGTQLFIRKNKKMLLNPTGQKIYDLACDILPTIESAMSELTDLRDWKQGIVRIGAECYSNYQWIPSLIRELQDKYPSISVELVLEATKNPLAFLEDEKIDLAIISNEIDESKFNAELLLEDEVILLCHRNHRFSENQFVEAEDLIEEHLFIHSFPIESVTVLNKLMLPKGLSPKKISAIPFTEAAIEMVKSELGILTMAKWSAKPYLKTKNLISKKITKKGLIRKYYAVYNNNHTTNKNFSDFIQILKSTIK